MLFELKEEIIDQPEKSVFRRVFVDDKDLMDLYVWYDLQKNIIGFQLCYDKRARAVTCKSGKKLLNDKIGMKGWGLKGNIVLEPDVFFQKIYRFG